MSKIMFHHNCLEQGGAERVVASLANAFSKTDDVIVATEWQGENEFKLEPNIRRIHVGLDKQDESKGRIAKVLIRNRNLRKLIKKEKPDIVIGFTRKPSFRALMASMGINVPVIIAVRANPWYAYKGRGNAIAMKLLYPRVDGAVFQTQMQKSFFPKYIQDRSTIILNPISDKFFASNEDSEKEKLVISTGRLVNVKNQAMLLRAFIKVHEEFPDYSLEIFGEDSFDGTKEKLETIITDNQAEDYISLKGGSNSLEIELQRAEIFAFSSDSEGMPNSLLEAMCMGLPSLATDCPSGGPATVIEDGVNGLLTPVKDEEKFAENLARLLRDKGLAKSLGENAKKVQAIVSSDAIVNQWREFIDKTIASR